MKKNYIIRLIIILLVVLCLLYLYASVKRNTNNEVKIEVINNNKVKEQITVTDLINLSDKKEFNKKYKNSKVIITDKISNIMINYIDTSSSYSTAYDVIFLKNNVKIYVGHGRLSIFDEISVGDRINVESRLVSCDDICLVRDINYKDDAGFNYDDNTKISIVKGK